MTFFILIIIIIENPTGYAGGYRQPSYDFFILSNIENPTGYAGGYRQPSYDFLSSATLKIPRGTPEAIINQAMTFLSSAILNFQRGWSEFIVDQAMINVVFFISAMFFVMKYYFSGYCLLYYIFFSESNGDERPDKVLSDDGRFGRGSLPQDSDNKLTSSITPIYQMKIIPYQQVHLPLLGL